jgi:phosphohistidine phosphatase
MRTPYLPRHAKSSRADPTLPDMERPLAPGGRRDAKRIAKQLAWLRGNDDDTQSNPTAVKRTRKTIHCP